MQLIIMKRDGRKEPVPVTEFEKATGITYLYGLAFDSEKIKNEVLQLTGKAVFSARALEFGMRFATEIRNGFVDQVWVKWTDSSRGFGLYAGRNYEKGEYIGEYAGRVRKVPFLFGNINDYCFRYPVYKTGFFHYVIDARNDCNETSFMNHSRINANCEAAVAICDGLAHLCLRTTAPVRKDEELLFDYGNRLWD